jgi:maltose-binding protein MalE
MNIKGRIFSAVVILAMLFLVCFRGYQIQKAGENTENAAESQSAFELPGAQKETLYVWYTDEALTDYMNSRALSFMEENEKVRIVPTLVSPVEYLENINDATMRGDAMPDIFLVTNDSLEKAYMAGLATQITDPESLVENTFPDTALKAVTYKEKTVAYPFYYETSLFLYNRTYLEQMAQTKAESLQEESGEETESTDGEGSQETDSTTGEESLGEADGETEEDTEETKIPEGSDDLIPATIDDLLTLADEYDAPEGVEAIFRWDVSDIFYNYFFAGNYLNVGGTAGDDASVIDIYNEQSVACMQLYQSLNQFFSIEADESSYDQVLQDFINGKTIFTVATTDAIAKLEQAKEDGTFQWEYDIATLPNVSDTLVSKGLSVTNAAVINGYSEHKEWANAFASYLCCHADSSLYERAGKLSAAKNVTYDNEKIKLAMTAYENSASLPKLMEASNFWAQLEVAYTSIWEGDDADETLQRLDAQIRSQLE